MMKKITILILCFMFNGIMAQEAEVQKAVDTFFEGFHAQDTVKMQSVMAKEIVFHSISESPSGSKFSSENAAEFAKSIASIPKTMKFEEKLLSYKILIDGSMAHAWTPYDFYVNGALSHSGVNSFQLYKAADGWKIVYIIDTRRK